MLLAVAALLLQPQAIPQNLVAPVSASVSTANADSRPVAVKLAARPTDSAGTAGDAESPAPAEPLLPEFDVAGATFEPVRTAPEVASLSPMVTVIVVPVPANPAGEADSAEPSDAPAVEVVQPRPTEEHLAQQRRMWLGLSVAQHGAAAFDAWSTRQEISSGAGRELNPMLRPFAGNASLYVAIQVGPLALDYVARRMMTSQHGWERHAWWLPQTLGTAMSLFSGAHNLSLSAAH